MPISRSIDPGGGTMSVLEGTVAPPGMHAENAKLLFLLAGLALTRCLGAWVPDWLDRYQDT